MRILSIFAVLVTTTLSAQCAFAELNPLWHGTWESEDGKTNIRISASRIEISDLEYRWTDATVASSDYPFTFGYSSERISQRELREQLQDAVNEHKRDSSGVFEISDPDMAGRVINAISPGVYKMMWTYGEGDFDVKYLLDGDKIIEINNNMYIFALRRFVRVAGSM